MVSEQGVFTYKDKWLLIMDGFHPEAITSVVGNIMHLTAITTVNKDLITDSISVLSAFWTLAGRQFQEVAIFNNNSLDFTDQLYPNKKFGLNGRHINITTLFWGPFIHEVPTNNGTFYRGMCVEIMEAMAYKMNFTYDVIFPPDGMWGSLVDGLWNGFPRQLETKGAFISVAPLSASWLRDQVCLGTKSYTLLTV